MFVSFSQDVVIMYKRFLPRKHSKLKKTQRLILKSHNLPSCFTLWSVCVLRYHQGHVLNQQSWCTLLQTLEVYLLNHSSLIFQVCDFFSLTHMLNQSFKYLWKTRFLKKVYLALLIQWKAREKIFLKIICIVYLKARLPCMIKSKQIN